MKSLSGLFDPQRVSWLSDPALTFIFDALSAGGGEARVVGGAVRDALLGRPVLEIDLAVTLSPERVATLFADKKIKVVPTGIDHGTLTLIVDKRPFEITTLREDLETDGRHAKVSFTDNWAQDARRRDFTMNALYLDKHGTLYDYVDGRRDLQNKYVRFIGDARARIQEDVLRILRFFRFSAWFHEGNLDPEGLEASRDLSSLLHQLSVERVWRELVKLLSAPDPSRVWTSMIEIGVIKNVVSEATNVARLRDLIATEKKYNVEPQPILRLASLLTENLEVATTIGRRLKISKRDMDLLAALVTLPSSLRRDISSGALKEFLYRFDPDHVRLALLLIAADTPSLSIEEARTLSLTWTRPHFPLQGSDLLAMGIAPGPEIGKALRSIESWWIEGAFHASKDACLVQARQYFKI